MGRSVLRHGVFVFALVGLSSQAFALEQLGAVSQVIQNRKVVEFSITSATAQVQAGTQITVQFKDNINCEATVEAVADKLARASMADCERFSAVVVGQAVHLSAFQTQAAAPVVQVTPTVEASAAASAAAAATTTAGTAEATAQAQSTTQTTQATAVTEVQQPAVAPAEEQVVVYTPKRGRFSLGLLANGATSLEFDEATITTPTESADIDFKIETASAIGIFAEYFYSAPNSSGFSLGLSIDAPRDIKSITASDSSGSYTDDDINNSVSFTTIYANYVYQWTKAYLFIGPNFSSPKFDSGEIGAYAHGSIGAQFGVGLMLNDQLALDFGIRTVGMFIDPYSDGTNSLAFNYGSSTGAQLNLKFFLN